VQLGERATRVRFRRLCLYGGPHRLNSDCLSTPIGGPCIRLCARVLCPKLPTFPISWVANAEPEHFTHPLSDRASLAFVGNRETKRVVSRVGLEPSGSSQQVNELGSRVRVLCPSPSNIESRHEGSQPQARALVGESRAEAPYLALGPSALPSRSCAWMSSRYSAAADAAARLLVPVCRSSRPSRRSSPSRIVSGWGGQPGMKRSTGTVEAAPPRWAGRPAYGPPLMAQAPTAITILGGGTASWVF
jgi:hypothetical protein